MIDELPRLTPSCGSHERSGRKSGRLLVGGHLEALQGDLLLSTVNLLRADLLKSEPSMEAG